MTLEDETGNTNVAIKTEVQERCSKALLGSRIAEVKGTLENREGVVHILAGKIEDVSEALMQLDIKSRDFH